MLNSKTLKPFSKRFMMSGCGCPDECRPECGYIGKVFHTIGRFAMFKVYYPVESFFRRIKERAARSCRWAAFTYKNYDFDSVYLYDVMAFKLKDLKKCLENGHSIQEKEDMDALHDLIKICGRLRRQRYDSIYHKLHDRKWGKRPHWGTKPCLDKNGKETGCVEMIKKDRPKVKNKKQRAQETKEFLRCYELGEIDRCADIDRMAEMLKKYSPKWWD